MSSRPILTCLIAILAAQLLTWVVACRHAQELQARSAAEFAALSAPQQAIDTAAVNYSLLAEAIFHETNQRRSETGHEALSHLSALDEAGCLHAEAMVAQDFFAHLNPNDPAHETPADRVRAQGLEIGFVAENIGEVFILLYESGERVYSRQVNGRTVFSVEPGGEPLGRRSYLQVAETLLDNWMASSGHRRNIVSPEADYFGSGCEVDWAEQLAMPMLSCVQLFFAALGGSLD